jgi:5-aminopentanamidase
MVVGVAQTRPALGDLGRNLETCEARLEDAAAAGCSLLVLTECALSGYLFETPEEAARAAEEVPGPATEALARTCTRLGLHAVVGLLERDGDLLRNTAVLLGPGGLVGSYRKCHLPALGVDRFVTPGEGPFEPFETPLGLVGIQICYELRFPEVSRAYALAGAELIAHPTNWPGGARPVADFVTRSRALENRVFLLTADRVGDERWARFGGWSQIVDPAGRRLAQAEEGAEGLVVAEVDPAEARVKDLAPERGQYELRLFDDRRPELYGALVGQREQVIAG